MKYSHIVTAAILQVCFSISVFGQIRTDFDRWMNGPAEPFKIIGNIYYVGAYDVTSFLITTPNGHILIDGGFRETAPRIEKNIKALGFSLKDVKILLNNHAHSDHAGGLAILKQKSGAKLFSVKEQAVLLERGGKNDFAYADKMTFDRVEVDELLKDGQLVELGGTKLKTHITPGHTKGSTSWTTEIRDKGQSFNVIFASSTTALDYKLIDNPRYPNIASDFEQTFAKLKDLEVDIFLASHAQFLKLWKKRAALSEEPEENPFVDPKGFTEFVERMDKAFRKKLDAQKQAAIKQDI